MDERPVLLAQEESWKILSLIEAKIFHDRDSVGLAVGVGSSYAH
jgi:hypothetical protein